MELPERRAGPFGPPTASARIGTSAEHLGFTPPPVTLRLKLVEGPYHWSLYLKPDARPRVGALVEWLAPWSPLRIEFGSRDVMRADFDPLPRAWARQLASITLQGVVLYPDGTAVATVAGTHAALAGFGRRLTHHDHEMDVRQVIDTPRDAPLLTPAQDEALRAAVDAGYYSIPRILNLKQLASKLGISSASLSERLRRAEGRVITRFTRDGSMTPWDARTLFEANAPGQPGDLSDEPETPRGPT